MTLSVVMTFPESVDLVTSGGGNQITLDILPVDNSMQLALVNIGLRGYSAYEIAVQNGFVGSEADWILSLESPDVSIVSPTNIGGNRAVLGNGNYADNTDTATIGSVIGITKTATTTGENMLIAYAGELNGFFGLTVNQSVYLSTNCTLTQTPPTSGYIQKLGVAVSSSSVLINISTPIEVL